MAEVLELHAGSLTEATLRRMYAPGVRELLFPLRGRTKIPLRLGWQRAVDRYEGVGEPNDLAALA